MSVEKTTTCDICNVEKKESDTTWYQIAKNPKEDSDLAIAHWTDEEINSEVEVFDACGDQHALILLDRWMKTGNLVKILNIE